MYDYSSQLEAFHAACVVLPKKLQDMLLDHRGANRDRLISRLPEHIPGASIGKRIGGTNGFRDGQLYTSDVIGVRDPLRMSGPARQRTLSACETLYE